MNLKDSRSPAK